MNGRPQKSMGDALKTVVRDVPEDYGKITEKSGASVLFNRLRREMLAELITHPCAHLRRIARKVELSPPAASWHLKRLKSAGYVRMLASGGKTRFYPAGMMNAETLSLAVILSDDSNFGIFTLIENEPGATRKQLEEGEKGDSKSIQKRLAILLKSGLVSTVRDGRYTRYFPTDLMKDARKMQGLLMKEYRRSLTARLREDGLDPKGSESARRIPQIHIQTPDGEKVLSLKCELF